jgi:hypothetical protein
LSAADEQVRAEGLVIGAGEIGGKDAAGCGHARKSGKWRVRVEGRGARGEGRGARGEGEGRRYTDGRWNADLVALGSGCSILF